MKKINVNENCIGCGACISIDEEHFDFDNESGTSIPVSQENLDSENLQDAINSCPVSAIEITETETENSDSESNN